MERKLIISECINPAYNLGLEEYLIEKKERCLYLWQNEESVVIGRNQNPYRECRVHKMREDGVHLVRRKSGGGAVFHDLGNLNYTIISNKYEGVIEENFAFVIEVLKDMGIEAKFSGRNDILVEGKKVSGNAFAEKGGIFCQHGTMLIKSDMNKLQDYLTVSELKLKSKGISSVKSRVANLTDFNPNIDRDTLIRVFSMNYPYDQMIEYRMDDMEKNPEIMERVNLYRDDRWNLGESPEADWVLENRFSWGTFEMNLNIVSGEVKGCKIFTDTLAVDDFRELEDKIIGCSFSAEAISKAIIETSETDSICKDISEWIINII